MIKGIAAPKRLSTCLKLKFYSMGYWFHTLQVIYTALKNKPLEMVLPPMRGLIAKLSNAFPEIAAGQVSRFRKKGMKRQTKVD